MKRLKDDCVPEDVESLEEPEFSLALIGVGVWGLALAAYVAMVNLGLIAGL